MIFKGFSYNISAKTANLTLIYLTRIFSLSESSHLVKRYWFSKTRAAKIRQFVAGSAQIERNYGLPLFLSLHDSDGTC